MVRNWNQKHKSLTLFIWILMLIAVLSIGLPTIPEKPIDPWELFSIRRLLQMVTALLLLQATAKLFSQQLSKTAGAFLTGFFGGFISSTAVTGQIARRSKLSEVKDSELLLTHSASTLAMLVEALLIVSVGTSAAAPSVLIVFGGPLIITLIQISKFWNRLEKETRTIPAKDPLGFAAIARLFGLLVLILILSRIAMHYLGKNGVYPVTFVASLFEVHASVMSNADLWATGTITSADLGDLVAISLMASLISKLILVFTLSKRVFAVVFLKWSSATAIILVSSWSLFRLLA